MLMSEANDPCYSKCQKANHCRNIYFRLKVSYSGLGKIEGVGGERLLKREARSIVVWIDISRGL
jgi:hypothetical protein